MTFCLTLANSQGPVYADPELYKVSIHGTIN